MNYRFPHISHIDDVLPYIEGVKEFIVADKGDYKVIDYVVAKEDTFPMVYDDLASPAAAIRRECRGLIFAPNGKLIRRAYHKFFNLNEKPDGHVDTTDFNAPHKVLVKLDGSMVTPFKIGEHIRWGTRMGVTETAMQAEVFVAQHPEYQAFAKVLVDSDITPIFEWCSRQNRIVLDHPEDKLILTAMRNMYTGQYYLSYEIAASYGIPVVEAFSGIAKIKLYLEQIRSYEDMEGVVVRFDNGHMVKIKTEWYTKIHRAKDIISQEHDIAHLILTNGIDDVKVLLPEEELNIVEDFEDRLLHSIEDFSTKVITHVEHLRRTETSRKEYALNVSPLHSPLLKALIFACWECTSASVVLQKTILEFSKHCKHKFAYQDFKKEYLKDLVYG